MMIVGCDFHPSWQQVAVFDSETGEMTERKLVNGNGEAERFYRSLPAPVADWHGEPAATVSGLWSLLQQVGARGLDRRCSADSGQLCAQAEDRQARCGTHSEAADARAGFRGCGLRMRSSATCGSC